VVRGGLGLCCASHGTAARSLARLPRAQQFDYNRIVEEKEVIRALAALAQSNRLQVFRTLVAAGRGGMTPGVMGESLQVAPATLSFHLKELLNAGLIRQQRTGRHLIYRVEYDRMNGVLAYLTDNCCQGADCLDNIALACDCEAGL